MLTEASGGADNRGIVIQAGRSRVRFPIVYLDFSLALSFRPHSGPGFDSARNRNESQDYILRGKGGRCVRLTTFPPSCTDCIEIWEPQTPVILETFYPYAYGILCTSLLVIFAFCSLHV
jgi:hypothetical protein